MVTAVSFILAALAAPRVGNAFSPSSIYSRAAATTSSRLTLDAKKKIFIDGEAGTTGLQVRDRIAARDDLEIISISDELRKDANERKRLINEADCVILCELFFFAHWMQQRAGFCGGSSCQIFITH